jgi:hypothetical protein
MAMGKRLKRLFEGIMLTCDARMARIFTCAPGVAKLMLGGSWGETGLPECFQYAKERLVKAVQKGQNGSVW